MAKNWREVRAEAVASGRIDPQRVDNARKATEAIVRESEDYKESYLRSVMS